MINSFCLAKNEIRYCNDEYYDFSHLELSFDVMIDSKIDLSQAMELSGGKITNRRSFILGLLYFWYLVKQ